jgi:phage terminase large subunit-like protein
VLNLPAIAEYEETIQIGPDKYHVRKVGDLLHAEREDHAVLQAMRNSLGSFNFAAQKDGEMFKLNWFRVYESEPARTGNDSLVQSWDTASKSGQFNDYSVCTTWLVKENDYFLLDVFRQKLGFPDLIRAIQSHADRFRPSSILIEDKASGS